MFPGFISRIFLDRLAVTLALVSIGLVPILIKAQTQSPSLKPDEVLLEVGKPVEQNITASSTQSFRIKVLPDQFAEIIIEQKGIDVVAELYSPEGTSIAVFDRELRILEPEHIKFVGTLAGDYRLDVRAKYINTSGRFAIKLVEIRESIELDRVLFRSHILGSEAADLIEQGKYDDAFTAADKGWSLANNEHLSDDSYLAYLLGLKGSSERKRGNYAEAELLYQLAFDINEKALGLEHPQTIDSILNLGRINFSRSNLKSADRFSRQALELAEKTLGPDHPKVAEILSSISIYLSDNGDVLQAEKFLDRALVISEKYLPPESILSAWILNNLGDIYRSRRDLDLAEKTFQRVLRIYEKNGGKDHDQYSNTLQNLGIIYRQKKDYPKALDIYDQALVIREKRLGPDHPNIASLLNNIANVYRSMGDYPKALEVQQRVLSIAEKNAGPFHGLTLLSIDNISRIYSAIGDTQNTLLFRTKLEDRTEKLMGLELSIGSERQKLAYFDRINISNDRTISMHVRLMPADQEACDLAALILLQRKGRVLDAMSDSFNALANRSDPEDRKLLDKLRATTERLGKFAGRKPNDLSIEEFQQQFSLLESEKEKLEAQISSRSAQFGPQSQTVTLQAVKDEIPENGALVEFSTYRPFDPKAELNSEAYGEPRYVAYILHNQGEVKWKDLGTVSEINEKISSFRAALRDPERKDIRDLARRLDEIVMHPIRSLLGNSTHLLVSPDGDLNLMPFEALVDQNGKYLIENYLFTYLTSGRDLIRMKISRDPKNRSLVVADPLFGETAESVGSVVEVRGNRTDPTSKRTSKTATRDLADTYFARISGTLEEARSIKSFFPNALVLTEAYATEAALKQISSPRILHIATHGFFLEDSLAATIEKLNTSNSRSPEKVSIENPLLRSGLALTGANQRKSGNEDGILTALEASGLDLWGTKLVVLSACDTGLGKVRNGEGVYGLRRAFVLAGSESIVMTLWGVSDYSTRILMTNFYKYLSRGIGRSDSLRNVQLEMLKRKGREHPFYWAGFIQSGEWRSLAVAN